jgi:hypothetical protein
MTGAFPVLDTSASQAPTPAKCFAKINYFFISCMYFYKNFFHNFDATGLASRAAV